MISKVFGYIFPGVGAVTNDMFSCVFVVFVFQTVKVMHPPNHPIVAFRPNKARSSDDDETFNGDLKKLVKES